MKNLPAQWKWILDGEQGDNLLAQQMYQNALDADQAMLDDEDGLALYEDEDEDEDEVLNPTSDRHP